MENIIQILIEETTHWMPRVGGAVFILTVFFIISKVIKSAITKGAERLKLDRNITSLLARIRSLTIIIFGFISALGTIGIECGSASSRARLNRVRFGVRPKRQYL